MQHSTNTNTNIRPVMNITNNITKVLYKDLTNLILKKLFHLSSNNYYYVTKKWDKIKKICRYAAENGYLDILKWARSNKCPWDDWTCAWAAWGGHLDVLKWARANKCPWSWRTCAYAALGGHYKLALYF